MKPTSSAELLFQRLVLALVVVWSRNFTQMITREILIPAWQTVNLDDANAKCISIPRRLCKINHIFQDFLNSAVRSRTPLLGWGVPSYLGKRGVHSFAERSLGLKVDLQGRDSERLQRPRYMTTSW